MADEYQGPATLRIEDIHVALIVDLTTNTTLGTYSWGGKATSQDLRLLGLRGKFGTLVFPSGQEGVVHVVHAEIPPDAPDVALRLHGSSRHPVLTISGVWNSRLGDEVRYRR